MNTKAAEPNLDKLEAQLKLPRAEPINRPGPRPEDVSIHDLVDNLHDTLDGAARLIRDIQEKLHSFTGKRP